MPDSNKEYSCFSANNLKREVVGGSAVLENDKLTVGSASLKLRLVTALEFEERDLRVIKQVIPDMVRLMARRKMDGPWSIKILDGSKEEEGHEHFQLSISQGKKSENDSETRLKIDYSQSYPDSGANNQTSRVTEEGVISIVVQCGIGKNEERTYDNRDETIKTANDRGTAMVVATIYQSALDSEYIEYNVESMPRASIQQSSQSTIEWSR